LQYLNKEFRNEEGSEPTSSSGVRAPSSTKNWSFEEHSKEEMMDLADATLFLTEPDKRRQGDLVKRLTVELVDRCRKSDRFIRVLSQRTHMLHCIHAAWSRNQYQRERVAGRHKGEKRPLPPSSSSGSDKYHDIQLGLELLFFLIDQVRDPESNSTQKRLFLDEILPVIGDLSPLSLSEAGEHLRVSCLNQRITLSDMMESLIRFD